MGRDQAGIETNRLHGSSCSAIRARCRLSSAWPAIRRACGRHLMVVGYLRQVVHGVVDPLPRQVNLGPEHPVQGRRLAEPAQPADRGLGLVDPALIQVGLRGFPDGVGIGVAKPEEAASEHRGPTRRPPRRS